MELSPENREYITNEKTWDGRGPVFEIDFYFEKPLDESYIKDIFFKNPDVFEYKDVYKEYDLSHFILYKNLPSPIGARLITRHLLEYKRLSIYLMEKPIERLLGAEIIEYDEINPLLTSLLLSEIVKIAKYLKQDLPLSILTMQVEGMSTPIGDKPGVYLTPKIT